MLPKVLVVVFIVVTLLFIGALFRSNPNVAKNIKQEAEETSECPTPLLLQTPVDINKVTSILYPGQVRGGDFKPHGGFRFDSSRFDEIEVRAPMDAVFESASRYIEQGEVQYLFDFRTPCGIMYRFDHLLVLAPIFAEAVKDLPEAKEDDSRTSAIRQKLNVKKGELIATAVGFRKNNNVFVDFGVYDMRGKLFQSPRENAICWFDLLPPEGAAKVKSLPPADSVSGSQSTLCKPK